ncbi:MAG: hypothetical protein Q8Q75_13700 [Rhodoferax sp.]|nr:hypothetical protein [Rhodoferax sp.]
MDILESGSEISMSSLRQEEMHSVWARLALADGVIGAGKGKYKAGRSR